MPPLRIAVLMTSHNRREKTLSALATLAGQRGLPEKTSLRTYLVDAGSTDGTPEAVRAAHPEVEVTTVGTDIYWSHGMRIASRNSRRTGEPPWDFQLWLNDDVTLAENALAVLLDTADAVGPGKVVVGAVRASDSARTTYSGRRGRALALVEPTGRPERCDTYNGNVVLLPRTVCDRVGDIDEVFQHGIGDYDHGFRVRQAGIPAYVTPCHVGICDLPRRTPGPVNRASACVRRSAGSPHSGNCRPGNGGSTACGTVGRGPRC